MTPLSSWPPSTYGRVKAPPSALLLCCAVSVKFSRSRIDLPSCSVTGIWRRVSCKRLVSWPSARQRWCGNRKSPALWLGAAVTLTSLLFRHGCCPPSGLKARYLRHSDLISLWVFGARRARVTSGFASYVSRSSLRVQVYHLVRTVAGRTRLLPPCATSKMRVHM